MRRERGRGDDADQRWNGRTSLRLTEVVARQLFDEHWNPAPGGAALAMPPGLDDRRMGRRGESEASVELLEARVDQLEKEVEELKTHVNKELVTLLKEMAAKVAEEGAQGEGAREQGASNEVSS